METDDVEAVFHDFITASDEASAMLRKLLSSQKREQVERRWYGPSVPIYRS